MWGMPHTCPNGRCLKCPRRSVPAPRTLAPFPCLTLRQPLAHASCAPRTRTPLPTSCASCPAMSSATKALLVAAAIAVFTLGYWIGDGDRGRQNLQQRLALTESRFASCEHEWQRYKGRVEVAHPEDDEQRVALQEREALNAENQLFRDANVQLRRCAIPHARPEGVHALCPP